MALGSECQSLGGGRILLVTIQDPRFEADDAFESKLLSSATLATRGIPDRHSDPLSTKGLRVLSQIVTLTILNSGRRLASSPNRPSLHWRAAPRSQRA
jgi:hypothetical protein